MRQPDVQKYEFISDSSEVYANNSRLGRANRIFYYFWAAKNTQPHVERNSYHSAACLLQCLHDVGMVRSYRLQIETRTGIAGPDCFAELEHRTVRILFSGAGQPHRQRRIRRSIHIVAAESDTRGNNTRCILILRFVFQQERIPAMEPSGRIRLSYIGCLFYFPAVKVREEAEDHHINNTAIGLSDGCFFFRATFVYRSMLHFLEKIRIYNRKCNLRCNII